MIMRAKTNLTLELIYDMDRDPAEITFRAGDTFEATITRETPYKVDLRVSGGDAYSVDKSAVSW